MTKNSEKNIERKLNKARQHGHAIDAASSKIKILMWSIFDKVDMASNLDQKTLQLMDAVSCYADCTLKQLEEINENRMQIMEIITSVTDGGKDA